VQHTKGAQRREGLFPTRGAHSINIRHMIIVCLLFSGLKDLTGPKEKRIRKQIISRE
jgi:hypothetical protein